MFTQIATFGSWLPMLGWWYVVFLLFGICSIPLASIVFSKFPDRGYALVKPLGLAIVGYALFFLGTFFKIPITIWSIIIILCLYAIFNWGLYIKLKLSHSHPLPGIKTIFLTEIIAFIAFLTWAYVRGHEPSLASLEKFMDLGFVASIVRNAQIPTQDMWYGPTQSQAFPINYYYFGHFITAILSILSRLQPSVAYNMMLATIFSTLLVGGFSVARAFFHALLPKSRVVPGIVAGIISAYVLNFAANLHTLYIFTKAYPDDSPVPFWKIWDPFAAASYWYPRATRFIPFTIHEFPSYSHIVADLHGHLVNSLHVLIIIALLLTIVIQRRSKFLSFIEYFLLALLLGISYMTNATDFLVYSAVTFIALTIRFRSLKQSIIRSLGIVIGAYMITLPFSLHFSSFVSGIGLNCAPSFLISKGGIGPFIAEKDRCQTSPLWMLAILWGFFWLVTFVYSYVVMFRNKLKARDPVRYFIFFMLCFCFILTITAEFIFFRDIYPAHFRANTMFKLGYQAYIMYALLTGPIIVAYILYLRRHVSFVSIFLGIPLFIGLILISIYPLYSIQSYYGKIGQFKTLDGARWIEDRYPDHSKLIQFLKKQDATEKKPYTVLEAHGDSYTEYNMISAYTGIPTIVGWPVHEWLWRGGYDKVSTRAGDVQTIYSLSDRTQEQVRSLLKQYMVRYVVISPLFEMKKYPSISIDQWYILGEPVFKENGTYLFKINQ